MDAYKIYKDSRVIIPKVAFFYNEKDDILSLYYRSKQKDRVYSVTHASNNKAQIKFSKKIKRSILIFPEKQIFNWIKNSNRTIYFFTDENNNITETVVCSQDFLIEGENSYEKLLYHQHLYSGMFTALTEENYYKLSFGSIASIFFPSSPFELGCYTMSI